MSEPVLEDSIFANISMGMSATMMEFHQCMFKHAKDYLADKRADLSADIDNSFKVDGEEYEENKDEIIEEEIEELVWHYNELADRCYQKIGYDAHAETLATAMGRLLIAASLMGKDAQQQMAEISQEIKKENDDSSSWCASIFEKMRADREARAALRTKPQ